MKEQLISKIALFGGNFDPPHWGHLHAMEAVLCHPGVAELWIVPSASRPDKQSIATNLQRLEMLQLLLNETFHKPKIKIEDCQLSGQVRTSFTIDLIAHLKAVHPGSNFIFCIGHELVPQLPSWREGTTLINSTSFLVIPRPGAEISCNKPNEQSEILSKNVQSLLSISSTEVRESIKAARPIDKLVPPSISAYIKAHTLYL